MSKINIQQINLQSKLFITILTFLLISTKIHAQFLWYENETKTENILLTNTLDGNFTLNEINPDTDEINTNAVTSKFVREADVTRGFSYFELSQNLLENVRYTISFKAYIDVPTADLSRYKPYTFIYSKYNYRRL